VSVVNPMIYSLEELGLTGGSGTDHAHRAIGNAVNTLSGAAVKLSAEVIAGSAAPQIVARAREWEADLIVLGTNERRGLSRFLFGSTSAAVASRAHCSVRVIRGERVSSTGAVLEKQSTANTLQERKKAA
jgi:nucleotide-binding universal stress UspA family protein